MKKIISLVLALVLTCALAVTCFAAYEAVNFETPKTADVKVTITSTDSQDAVYGVDVVMETAVTYSFGKVWSPETLNYIDAGNGAWSDDTCSVTVENRSNAALWATVKFTATDAAVTVNSDGVTEKTLEFAAATVGHAPDAQTASFKLAGNLSSKGAGTYVVGNMTVTFATEAPAPAPQA